MYLENNTSDCILKSYVDTIEADKNIPPNSCPLNANHIKTEDSDDMPMVRCLIENLNDLPFELKSIFAGFYEKLPDTTELPAIPDWVDIERVKKGQQFGLRYLYGLNYSQTLSLLYLFASPEGLKPLIFTEKSHTPKLAHKRYLSTAIRVKSWYETEFWKPNTKGYSNLKAVKTLHLGVSKRLNRMSRDDFHKQSNLEEKMRNSETGMLCPLQSILQKDFKKPSSRMNDIKIHSKDRIYFNQLEMSLTQFGFFGLMLIYPDRFAAKKATTEDFECFVHLWKFLGHLLGIKDDYNFCSGDLETVKLRAEQFIEYIVRPMILNVNKEWEHMSRCALQGIEKFTKLRINFEATMLYFCWILNIPTPNLVEYIGWKEKTMFNITKFMMKDSYRIPGFAKLLNYSITKTIEKAEKEYEKTVKNHSHSINNQFQNSS